MMRRARLSVRPNVRPGGRAAGPASAATARDGGVAPAADPVPDPGKESDTAAPGESGATEPGEPAAPRAQEEKPAEPIEPSATVSHETPGRTSSAPLQRRKRISTLPNLVKPRVSNSTSAVPPPKPSQVEVPSTPPVIPAPCKIEGSSAEKGKVLSPQKSQVLLSPPQGQLVTLPEKRTPVPHVPQFSPYKKSVLKHQDVSPAKPVESALKEDASPLKELPSQKSCSNDLNEPAKKTTPRKIITSNLEKERLQRAQKLRDLLKDELRKERKAWRAKHPFTNPMAELEKSKMTMRDFIYFIPMSNPMSSSLEENRNSEKSSPVEPQAPGLVVKNNAEEEDVDDDDEEDDSQMLAPRVKVAEDGSIILDEESLTVEVTRNKAPIVEGNDPIFERGSTTTYSSFRRRNYSKPWSNEETDLFFLAISMVGTDFTMISHLFPHRERIEIKNKFKKEERANGWRIDKAFREKTDFDFDFFAQLLEKALDEGKKKKTSCSQPRKTNTKPRKKQKDKVVAEQSLHDEDSVISGEEGANAGIDEKENKRSPDGDECSGVADPVKKKKSKRKKESAKKPEEENQEAQDEDVTQKPRMEKSGKSKTPAQDTDNRPELHSVGDDGNLEGTLAEKTTKVQEKESTYIDTEMEDENDGDFAVTEHSEDEDAHVSCDAGEPDPSSQSPAPTCEEEASLILFSEDCDLQSGSDDLSGIHHDLSEVTEAESQASNVPSVAINAVLGETEPVNVAQEETSCSVSDKFGLSDKVLEPASDQPSEQDQEPMDNQEMPQSKAQPAPNLSTASVEELVSTEEQSDHPADVDKDIIVGKGGNKIEEECLGVEEKKQTENAEKEKMSRERRARPAPNLSRASLKKKVSTEEQCEPPEDHSNDIDVGKSNNKVQEECFSADQQKQTDEAEKAGDSSTAHNEGKESSVKPTLPVRSRFQRPKPNLAARTSARRGTPDVPESTAVLMEGTEKCAEIADIQTENKKEDAVTVDSGEVGISPVDEHRQDPSSSDHKDVGSEPAAETEEAANPGQLCSDTGDSIEVKPALPVRGRLRPMPNLTKTAAQKKSPETKQGSDHPPVSDRVSDVDIKSPSRAPGGDQERKAQEREESSSGFQDECGKSSIKLAPLARGRLQRPKPNLIKAVFRKGALVGKENSPTPSAGQDEGDIAGVFPSDDRSEKQENGMKNSKPGSSQDSCKSEINSHSSSSTQDGAVIQEPLTEGSHISETPEIKAPVEPAPLPRGRFQKPKPNLARLSERKVEIDIKGSKSFEAASGNTEMRPASDEIHSSGADNIPGNEADAASLPENSNEKSSVTEGDSVILDKADNGAPPGTCAEPPPDITDKEQSATDEERKTSKPVVTRGRLQRPKPNLSKSTPRSAVTAPPPVSAVREEETRPGTTCTGNDGSNMSADAEVLLDAENKSPAVKATCDGAAGKALAQPKETVNDTEKDKAAPLKPFYTRFPKPSPNLGRAAVRKEASTTEPSKTQGLPETSTAGQECKEAGPSTEEKSATIKPALLRRGRLIRPVPNLVKPSAKTSSPLQSKKTLDLSGAAADKDKDHVVTISSPNKKRKAPDCNADLSPKRLCTTQKPKCLSDSEVDRPSLTDEAERSSQTSSAQHLASPQRSRFGRPLRKLSTLPSVSPKSENASDHGEKEKAAHSVKSSTTKLSKPVTTKSKGKTTLVKLRATQQEDDDDEEEEDPDIGFEDENYDLSPDMQNQAPVFIPFHLRSPKPVPAEIEETVEELEIPVDLENCTSQDLGTSLSQHVVDPQVHADKKDSCDGSTEVAMTLISMGSSVYEPNTGEPPSPDDCTESDPSSNTAETNEGPLTSPELPSSPSSPHDNVCAGESSVTVDPRIAEGPPCAPSPQKEPVIGSVASPVEQVNDAMVVGDVDALQQEFSSHHVGVSDCLLGEQNTGAEATFILTLVEIPINDGYTYSCDSSMAESLPAPVLVSSGSTEPLTESLNPSVLSVSPEPPPVLQEGQDLSLGKRRCTDDGDLPPPPKKASVSEMIDPNIKPAAVEGDGDGNVAPEVSDTEPVPEGPAGDSAISTTAVIDGPPNWPVARTTSIVPVEMPGMSMTDPLNRNLPLSYAHPVTTSKSTLKRPGRKPLGFLSLVCKEKQSKKAKPENRKKKLLPKKKCRKISPTVRGRQKETPDLTLEKVNDNEVPSSSAAETQSATPEPAIASEPEIPDNQDTELQSSSKSPVLATEEDAAPVSEYFFSDIFMEVDD